MAGYWCRDCLYHSKSHCCNPCWPRPRGPRCPPGPRGTESPLVCCGETDRPEKDWSLVWLSPSCCWLTPPHRWSEITTPWRPGSPQCWGSSSLPQGWWDSCTWWCSKSRTRSLEWLVLWSGPWCRCLPPLPPPPAWRWCRHYPPWSRTPSRYKPGRSCCLATSAQRMTRGCWSNQTNWGSGSPGLNLAKINTIINLEWH